MVTEQEITPGLVLFLSAKMLVNCAKIATVPQREYADHLFVVFHEAGNDVMVSALTTTRRWERLEILPEWRAGGTPGSNWLTGTLYLNDGASFYVATKKLIAHASEIDRSFATKHLTVDGLLAVWAEVRKQKSRRVNGLELF